MFKTNQKKRKGNSSSDSNPPRKKRKFNPPKFGNLPSKAINPKPSSTSSTTTTSSKQHKSSSKPPSKPNKRNKSKKFVALMPQRGLPLKMKPKSFKNGTTKNNAKNDNNEPKKEMIFGRKGKGKKFKFVPPKIVDHEAAKRNLRAYVADLYSAYGKALGCLGFRKEKTTLPKHDPEDDGAIVLWRPEELSDSDDESDDDVKDEDMKDEEEDSGSEGEVQQFKISSKVKNALATKSKKKKGNKHKIKVPIVVDPRLGCKLRHHQVVGVEFVYRCMMDKKYAPNNEYGEGCILADGMGLGKTLQAITVMWTLMEQDVFAGEQTCSNGIVISPASLVANWELEITKWLGKTGKTMKPYPCLSKTKDVIKNWLSVIRSANCGAIKPVLIISYESYRSYHETICYKNGKKNKIKNEIGFVVCDEGHKLKNYKSQLSVAVSRIKSKKRMLLSGTPIQNDLKEMYSLVNFVNPGVWSSVKDFSSDACRIVRSFDSSASKKVNQKGEQALNSVRSILNKFLLQRTSKVVMKYLPKKSEYVVFCKLSAFQQELYQTFLKSKIAKQAKDAASSGSGLSAIGFLAVAVLSKICNHPALIYEQCAKIEKIKINKSKWRLISSASKKSKKKKKKKANVIHSTSSEYDRDGNRIRTELKGLFHLYPSDFLDRYISAQHSSKMAFTLSLLSQLRDQSTGDKTVIVSVFTETLDILALILQKCCIDYKRLDGSIPTKKRQPIVDEFNDANSKYLVLLLSNRAGGCGLNLIGANRLIMFDADWNPANDAQAMARVWRSGQLKETYIYRLFSTGTLEEKIFQRQTFKSDLAEQLVAAEEDMTDMTEFAVKELKKIFVYNASTDCDTLERTKKKGYTSWIKTKVCVMCGDPFLTRAAKPGKVSFLFRRIVNDPKDRIDAEDGAEDKNHNVGKEEVDEDNDVVMKENINKFGNTRSTSRRRSSSVKSNKSESESTALLVLKKKKKKMVDKNKVVKDKKKSVKDKKKGKVLDLVSDSDDDANYADYSESDGDFKPKYDSQSDSDSESESDND